jgi:dihydrofolate reductase
VKPFRPAVGAEREAARELEGVPVRVLAVNHVSLDGVLQGPGRPDEDTRDGFRHGGWARHANEPTLAAALAEWMGPDFSWLFGRRSYEDMLTHWNQVGGPFRDGLNRRRKYVASARADAELPWPNSTLLSGDVPAEIAALREQPGGNLVIMGSGQLIRSLFPQVPAPPRPVGQWSWPCRPRVSTGVAPGRVHCGTGRLVGPQVGLPSASERQVQHAARPSGQPSGVSSKASPRP